MNNSGWCLIKSKGGARVAGPGSWCSESKDNMKWWSKHRLPGRTALPAGSLQGILCPCCLRCEYQTGEQLNTTPPFLWQAPSTGTHRGARSAVVNNHTGITPDFYQHDWGCLPLLTGGESQSSYAEYPQSVPAGLSDPLTVMQLDWSHIFKELMFSSCCRTFEMSFAGLFCQEISFCVPGSHQHWSNCVCQRERLGYSKGKAL